MQGVFLWFLEEGVQYEDHRADDNDNNDDEKLLIRC